MRKLCLAAFVFLLVIYPVHICHAQIETFSFDIFTSNSPYADDPGWDLYVDVWDGVGVVNFTFYNNSSLQSSAARIYFDDGSLLGVDEITNSIGYTEFDKALTPGDLPGGSLLAPPFVADREFTIGSEAPPPWKGVNNGDIVNEWVTVRFNLINGGTLDDVVAELWRGIDVMNGIDPGGLPYLRVGMHIIDLPGGYSESAVIPEPATVLMFGLGALVILRKRRP